MATKSIFKGSTLKITITGTPTLIPSLQEVNPVLDGSSAEVDVTDLDDTDVQTYVGLMNLGKIGAKGFWDNSNAAHVAIRTQWRSRTNTATFLATLTDPSTTTVQTVGPITMFKITGGTSNTPLMFEFQQKVNSHTVT